MDEGPEGFATAASLMLVFYAVLITVGMTSTAARYIRYRRAHMRIPKLLLRDLTLISTHAIPLLVILSLREMDVIHFDWSGAGVNSMPVFWLGLLGPAILGICIYVYFELFVIER